MIELRYFMTVVTTSHIVLDELGRAFVEGTRTRVAMIVMDKMNGLAPEQIQKSYPYLSMSRIYAALAYYYDNQAEFDVEIAREAAEIKALRDQAIAAGIQPNREEIQRRVEMREKRP
jgi:uncharacterized protein (DUF433 family)